MKMKPFLKTRIASLVLVVLFTGACDDYLNVNTSPNSVVDAPIGQIFTPATVAVGFLAGSDIHRFTSIFAQQFGGQGTDVAQTREYMRYQLAPSDVNNLWNNYYVVALADIEVVIKKAGTTSPRYAGIAKLMKAYVFSQIVDAWGDVPYSEALKFLDNMSPTYDASGSIYTSLFALIDESIVDLSQPISPTNVSPGTFDTFFGGDGTKWIRVANSLKLRMLMRQSKSNPAATATAVNALLGSSATFVDAVAHNFQHTFLTTSGRQNPIHQFEVNRIDQFFPHENLVDMMNTKLDPRRASYFTPFPFNSAPATYKGVAAVPGPQAFDYSRIHTYLRGSVLSGPASVNTNGSIGSTQIVYSGNAPTRLLTAAEYFFTRAEASVRFGSPGTPEAHFEAGIRASMTMAGVATADADAYVAARLVTFLAANDAGKIEQIIEEKFVANYGVPLEAWSDWRRTGLPTFIAPPANAALNISGGGVPRVFPYALGEQSANPNTPERANLASGRVFWDTP
jgi:hypothetical protein